MLAVQRCLSIFKLQQPLSVFPQVALINPMVYQSILSAFEPSKSFSSNFKSPLDVTLNLTSLSTDPMERNGNNLVPGRWDKQRLDRSQRIWGGAVPQLMSSVCYFKIPFLFPIIELNYLQIPKPLSMNTKQHIITPNICNLKFYSINPLNFFIVHLAKIFVAETIMVV